MLGVVQTPQQDIRIIFSNKKYQVSIVDNFALIKIKHKRKWTLKFKLCFSRHKMIKYLKYNFYAYNMDGNRTNYCRLSSCDTINEVLDKDYQLPTEILQELDDFLDSTELYGKMGGNMYENN